MYKKLYPLLAGIALTACVTSQPLTAEANSSRGGGPGGAVINYVDPKGNIIYTGYEDELVIGEQPVMGMFAVNEYQYDYWFHTVNITEDKPTDVAEFHVAPKGYNFREDFEHCNLDADSSHKTEHITRAQVASILACHLTESNEMAEDFGDTVGSWHSEPFRILRHLGVFKGDNDLVNPHEDITQKQLVEVIERYSISLGNTFSYTTKKSNRVISRKEAVNILTDGLMQNKLLTK